MSDSIRLKKARLFIIAAAIAAGFTTAAGTASAAESVSERDMVLQAVALYEKLSGEEIAVPEQIAELSDNPELCKAVVLGFINTDDLDTLSESIALRKQDAVTVLYKTIIDFDDSFALSSEEVDEILSECYDNAMIDEENRVGYAFMLKHGIISNGIGTEPNKEINWDGCRVLVNNLYKLFSKTAVFNVGDTAVEIGANISTVTDVLGEPDRIDSGEFGYDWYVYNSDYSRFMMIGVENGRICAFYSNSGMLTFDGISLGEDVSAAADYGEYNGYRIYRDNGGHIDSVLYIDYEKCNTYTEIAPEVAAFELTDMINAARARNGLDALTVSQSQSAAAQEMSAKTKYMDLARDRSIEHLKDGAQHEIGYDTFTAYAILSLNGGSCYDSGTHVIGIGTSVTDDYFRMVSIITNRSANDTVATDSEGLDYIESTSEQTAEDKEVYIFGEEEDEAPTTVAGIYELIESSVPDANVIELDKEDTEEDAPEAADGTNAPVKTPAPDTKTSVDSSSNDEAEAAKAAEEPESEYVNSGFKLAEYNGVIIEDGNDLAISMETEEDKEYYVKVYSFEKDDYIVNSYLKTKDGILTLKSDIFESGMDYAISISPADNADAEPDEFVISYGSAPEDEVDITSHEDGAVIDDDALSLCWSSSLYTDFLIEIYNSEGELELSEEVEGSHAANIRNIKPGEYDVHVCAVRRGSKNFVKAESSIKLEVKLPEPIITEYILDDGEKFFPVYADEELGLVYFYDENIIDTTVTAPNGQETTVKRKKITEKQVKATDYYKELAERQPKIDHYTGSDKLDIEVNEEDMSVIAYDSMVVSDNPYGEAIIAEAKKYLGVPYLWGGTTPMGFDCSGLCQYVLRNVGLSISRVSQTQYKEGVYISREDLQPGDLVFFQKNGDVHHVGIYAGDGFMIHAPYTGAQVRYESIDKENYVSEFCGGRRIFNTTDTEATED
ncbi:MAG: C40 family peptidase [Clostridia bacterium]|nr:C40 family peptidase [Clostridia bacterium]